MSTQRKRLPSPVAKSWQAAAVVVVATGLWTSLPAQGVSFRRGDVNVDAAMDITDTIFVLERLFLISEPLPCLDAADTDDDGRVNITDALVIAGYLFLGTREPASPFGACGEDPSSDRLDCAGFAPCDLAEDLCLSEEILGEALGESTELAFCLPAGILEFPLDRISVSVCPADLAQPCGVTEQPGCPIELTSVRPFVDIAGRKIGLHVEGRIENLPVRVSESVFNTTADCLNDFGGAAAGTPFSMDLVIPLLTAEVSPGVFEVTGTDDGSLENVDLRLDSSGGLLCVLLEAGQDAFLALLLAPLEQALAAVAENLDQAVVGLRLCP